MDEVTDRFESGNAILQTIHASEGGRALKLLQERQRRQKQLAEAKSEIENTTKRRRIHHIDEKYQGSTAESLEEEFKKQTVGLITAEEFREKRKRLAELIEEERKQAEAAAATGPAPAPKGEPQGSLARGRSKVSQQKISFRIDDSEDEDDEADGESIAANGINHLASAVDNGEASMLHSSPKRKGESYSSSATAVGDTGAEVNDDSTHSSSTVSSEPDVNAPTQLLKRKAFGKDPTIDTSYLADTERSERLRLERERLVAEYNSIQEAIKNELLEVTYSYWDGTGHRRIIQIKKGATIGQFLQECRRELEKDFPELRSTSTDNLMYIKEDLILPQSITFYELIKTKARGKSGPLFNFDVHDDIRIRTDIRVEKDESHAGKIVDKKWYEKNKHIFPASRWEPFNPNKSYEKYTIHGHKDFSVDVQR